MDEGTATAAPAVVVTNAGIGGQPAAAPAAPLPTPTTATTPAPAPAPVAPPPPDPDQQAGKWPTDWRESYSKDDAKKLEKLQRYGSPEAAFDAMFAAQQKISSGELKPTLRKDATPEQLAEWRKAHDVPQTPDAYALKGVAIEDAEKPMFEALFRAAHETNQTNDQVAATAKTWGTIKQKALQDQATAKASEDSLRAEWGPEFRRNINLITGLLDGSASPQMKDKLLSGRLADGTPIGSSPEALKMLLGLALLQNPTGVIVPGGHASVGQAVDDEIAATEKLMRTDRKAYDRDEKLQARYRDLLAARDKMKAR
jgi:hypothetical protein